MLKLLIDHDLADAPLLARIEKHLCNMERDGSLTILHRGKILPGAELTPQWERWLRRADLLLILISADYNANCSLDILQRFRKQRLTLARIVPILAGYVEDLPNPLRGLEVFPADGRPLSGRADLEACLSQLAQCVRRLILLIG